MRREPSSLLRFVGGLLLAGAAGTVALAGCGSRGPLDEATSVTLDAGVEAEAVVDAEPPVEAAAPVTDAGRRDAGPVACGVCVISTCGDTILSCIQTPACLSVFQCVATTCLAGGGSGGGSGGLDPLCLFQCAGQDPSGALGVLSIFQCITGDCGSDCGSVLGGLGGGLPGGGGGGGGGGKGGGKGNGAPEAFRELFSPWPELFSPATPSAERAPR